MLEGMIFFILLNSDCKSTHIFVQTQSNLRLQHLHFNYLYKAQKKSPLQHVIYLLTVYIDKVGG